MLRVFMIFVLSLAVTSAATAAWTERYVRADAAGGGDGTTDANSGANGAFTLAEAIADATAGRRYNVRAGTYANTTTNRTFSGAGSTTAPIWWRGFSSTPGDMDAGNNNSATKPSITFTTGLMTISGAYQTFSNISIVSERTAAATGALALQAAPCQFDRCDFENTAANANSCAISIDIAAHSFNRCWFKATSTATYVVRAQYTGVFNGCVFVGGGHGIGGGANNIHVLNSLFIDNGGDGINSSAAAQCVICGNAFYSPGSDGIEFSTLPATSSANTIANNIFEGCAAYGVNNSTGANTGIVHVAGNYFRASGTADTNGFGDSPIFATQDSDGASPFTNAGSNDFSLVSTSVAVAKAIPGPGAFNNLSTTTPHTNIGAAQTAVSGGATFPNVMGGGPVQ